MSKQQTKVGFVQKESGASMGEDACSASLLCVARY